MSTQTLCWLICIIFGAVNLIIGDVTGAKVYIACSFVILALPKEKK